MGENVQELFGLFNRKSHEVRLKEDQVKKVKAAARDYEKIYAVRCGSGRYSAWSLDKREKVVEKLAQKWLDTHTQGAFSGVDELELMPEHLIRSSDHAQRPTHKRITFNDLGTSIAQTKAHLGIDHRF